MTGKSEHPFKEEYVHAVNNAQSKTSHAFSVLTVNIMECVCWR